MRVHEVPVVAPYRLDLTVCALRRLSINVVDLLTPEGVYVRALSGFRKPVIVRVGQNGRARALAIAIDGGVACVRVTIPTSGPLSGSGGYRAREKP